MRPRSQRRSALPRLLIALVLLNGLVGALVWTDAVPYDPPARAAAVRVGPGWTVYLVVGLIDTRLPSDIELLAGYRIPRIPRPPTVLRLQLWLATAGTRSVTPLVAWRLSLGLLAVLPVGASLVLLVVSRRGHWWRSPPGPAHSGSPRSR